MGLEKYESKQVRILRPASLIYTALSDFSRFTPIVRDKVEEWEATEDTCSFKVQGFRMNLRIVEREPYSLVKITGDEGSPFPFFFWMQLQEVEPNDTRMRLVAHVELNMMMKMMVGAKIKEGLDKMAEQIAEGFNNAPF